MRRCPQCDLRDHDERRTRCIVCGAELVEHTDERLGTVLGGRYRLEDVIGEGGMATVYRARHTLMERPYAVKILHRNLAVDESLVERMRREGRSTASLTHPNIVEIYDFGMTDDGAPYLVMELLDGEPLRKILMRGRIGHGLMLELAMQIARGLARAHDFGVVHRDLKPENIFVCNDEHGAPLVKIVDFGIARSHADPHLTARGEVVGTPQYMAPERATSRDVSPGCDLYSLGVVLFEMATGVLPFQSNSPTGFVLKHLHEKPRRPRELDPGVPEALEGLILELLEKDPAARPVDAHQVLERLRALSPTGEVPTPRPSKLPPEQEVREDTASVDRWQARVGLFEQMLERAYPGGRPPHEMVETLAELRAAIGRLDGLRQAGVRAQRELDGLSKESREGSERLGHAVHVLAKDLSRAREEARSARLEAASRADAADAAKAGFHRMLAKVEAMLEARPEHPEPGLVERSRAVADAAEAWHRADDAAARSRARYERSEAEVRDLDYQVAELRRQLARLEAAIAERGETSRLRIQEQSEELRETERRVVDLAGRFVRPLRDRPELAELFVALEGTAPATQSLARPDASA
ncbi:MAG TPA: protein kinase [Sandaracinaceae bacterium LLY-WYZ-13_1]|nr:protein kinase [Sandaracinaceae bacterium LLY-WYZ-13_1]